MNHLYPNTQIMFVSGLDCREAFAFSGRLVLMGR